MPPKVPSIAELRKQAARLKAELAVNRARIARASRLAGAKYAAASLSLIQATDECCARVADIEAYLAEVDAWIDWATPRIKAAAGPGSGDEPTDPKWPPS